jgi:hypothetical protein
LLLVVAAAVGVEVAAAAALVDSFPTLGFIFPPEAKQSLLVLEALVALLLAGKLDLMALVVDYLLTEFMHRAVVVADFAPHSGSLGHLVVVVALEQRSVVVPFLLLVLVAALAATTYQAPVLVVVVDQVQLVRTR